MVGPFSGEDIDELGGLGAVRDWAVTHGYTDLAAVGAYPANDLRSAHRYFNTPGFRYSNLGFRPARSSVP